jgi:acetyltransferase-like isoleucine patch superfamily enzyme
MLGRLKRLLARDARDPELERRGIRVGTGARLGGAVLEGPNIVKEYARLSGRPRIGAHTTIGPYTVIQGRDDQPGVVVGRYCQIGPNVAVYSANHRTDLITTYVNPGLFGGALKGATLTDPVTIGHDVWIGHGAVVLPGVTLGTGAVIGAGAVVTRSVEPYALAVGNPARTVRRRFDDELVAALLAWRWWDLSPAEIERFRPLFLAPLQDRKAEFLAALEEACGRSGHVDDNATATETERKPQ